MMQTIRWDQHLSFRSMNGAQEARIASEWKKWIMWVAGLRWISQCSGAWPLTQQGEKNVRKDIASLARVALSPACTTRPLAHFMIIFDVSVCHPLNTDSPPALYHYHITFLRHGLCDSIDSWPMAMDRSQGALNGASINLQVLWIHRFIQRGPSTGVKPDGGVGENYKDRGT